MKPLLYHLHVDVQIRKLFLVKEKKNIINMTDNVARGNQAILQFKILLVAFSC